MPAPVRGHHGLESLFVEIVDYLGALGSRCWVMIVIPLLAGLVFAAVAFHAGFVYQANAQIQSPTLTGVRGAESDGNQYSIELESEIQVEIARPAVLAEISKRTGVSVRQLRSGLSVGRRKPSSFVVVSYSGNSAKKTATVAGAAATVAYGDIISYEQQVSAAPLDSAETSLASSRQAIAALAQQSAAPDPVASYIVARAQVARLEASLAKHLADGNQAAAAKDQAALTVSRQGQSSLVPLVGTQRALIDQRDQDRTARDVKYREYVKAENRIESSDPSKAVHVGPPKKQIPVKEITILGGAAGGVALGLMLLIQSVSETKRWQRIRGGAGNPLIPASDLPASD